MNMSLEEFVLENKMYVKIISKYYYEQVANLGIEFDDLCQVGYLALIENYDKYDSSKACPSTYAYMIIKYKILKYINNNISFTHVPYDMQLLQARLTRKKAEFYRINGRNMSLFEMLDYVNNECNLKREVDVDLIKLLLIIEKYHLTSNKYSFEEKIINSGNISIDNFDGDSGIYIKDVVADDYNLEEEVMRNMEADEIISYIENNFEEKNVQIFKETLGLIDGIPKTRREVSQQYGISYQAVEQRYKKTLNLVKKNFGVL